MANMETGSGALQGVHRGGQGIRPNPASGMERLYSKAADKMAPSPVVLQRQPL